MVASSLQTTGTTLQDCKGLRHQRLITVWVHLPILSKFSGIYHKSIKTDVFFVPGWKSAHCYHQFWAVKCKTSSLALLWKEWNEWTHQCHRWSITIIIIIIIVWHSWVKEKYSRNDIKENNLLTLFFLWELPPENVLIRLPLTDQGKSNTFSFFLMQSFCTTTSVSVLICTYLCQMSGELLLSLMPFFIAWWKTKVKNWRLGSCSELVQNDVSYLVLEF